MCSVLVHGKGDYNGDSNGNSNSRVGIGDKRGKRHELENQWVLKVMVMGAALKGLEMKKRWGLIHRSIGHVIDPGSRS